MTPAARVQAAVELLDAIIDSARAGGAAADTLIARYFSDRRYAGSKDRRAVRELVYAAIRRAGELPASGRAAVLALADDRPDLSDLFDGSPHGPAPIRADEPRAAAGIAPAWVAAALGASGIAAEAQAALLARAPLDLRANRLRTTRAAMIAAYPDAVPTPQAPDGLRLPAGSVVEASDPFRSGLVEVQDEGSQLVAAAAGAEPGMNVIDLCAGAGGKTLALAAAMADRGAIIACDTDRARLSRLAPRAARAGVTIATMRLLDPGREAAALGDVAARADLVLVDAPCSGTGTWRRNPEGRWRLTPERLDRLIALQARLLALAATLVRPGGRVCYIVCSLLDGEGAGQVEAFLRERPDWTVQPVSLPAGRPRGAGYRLEPALDLTDGFFVATVRAP